MRIIQNETKDEMIQEAKIFAIIAPTILPLIERRRRDAHGRLIQLYRSGNPNNLTIVAELSVLADLESEIRQKTITYDTLTGEPNAGR